MPHRKLKRRGSVRQRRERKPRELIVGGRNNRDLPARRFESGLDEGWRYVGWVGNGGLNED